MPDDITVTGADGTTYTIPNTPENINTAISKGYSLPQSAMPLDTSVKAQPALDTGTSPLQTAMAESGLPTPPQYSQRPSATAANERAAAISSPVAAGTPLGTVESKLSDIDITPDGNARVFNKDGQEYNIPNTPENIKVAKDKGYFLVSDSGLTTQQQVAEYHGLSNMFKERYGQHIGPEAAISEATGGLFAGLMRQGGADVSIGPFRIFRSEEGQGLKEGEQYQISATDGGPAIPVPNNIKAELNAISNVHDRNIIGKAIADRQLDPNDVAFASKVLDDLHSEHPIAKAIGNMMRPENLALMAAAGPVGEAAVGAAGLGEAATFGGKVAASTVKNLVQGAVMDSAHLAAQTIVNNDPKGAIENLGLMTGGGMVLDGLFGVGGKALSSIIGKVGTEEAAGTGIKGFLAPERNIVTNNYLEAFGFKKDILGAPDAVKENIVKTLNEEPGLSFDENVKISGNKFAKKVEERLQARGEEIGAVRDKLDSIQDSELISHNNKPIEEVIAESKFNTKSVLEKLEALAKSDYVNEDVIGRTMKKLAEDVEPGTAMTFNKAAQAVSKLGREANSAFKTNDSLGHAYNEMKKIVGEELDRAANAKAVASGNAGLMAEYDKSMNAYSTLKQVGIPELRAQTTLHLATLAQQHGGAGGIVHALLGHAVGGTLGALIGAAANDKGERSEAATVGGAVGLLGGMVAGRMYKGYMERAGTKRIANWLLQPNNAIVKAAAERTALLDKIPGYVKLLAQKGISASNIANHLDMSKREDAIKNVLGDTTGMSKQKQAEAILAAVNNATNNPELWNQNKALLMDSFGQYPNLQQAGNIHLDTALAAIATQMPPTPEKHGMPFDPPKTANFTPAQIDKMNTVLHYVQHPQAVLQDLHQGTLSAEKVALANTLNPSIMGAIKQEITQQGYSSNTELDYQKKLQVGIFLGLPIASGVKNVQNFQQSWAASSVAAAANNNQPVARGQGHRGNKITPTSSATTFHSAGSLTGAASH